MNENLLCAFDFSDMEWTAAIICRFFSESNDCWFVNKTTTKKHVKLTFYRNFWKEILTNQLEKENGTKQYLRRHLYPKVHQKKSLPKTTSKRNLHPKKSSCFRHEKKAKIETNENLVKARCFIRFHQFRFLPCFLFCFFSRIFWWRCFFILFGRDVSSIYLVGKCLLKQMFW